MMLIMMPKEDSLQHVLTTKFVKEAEYIAAARKKALEKMGDKWLCARKVQRKEAAE